MNMATLDKQPLAIASNYNSLGEVYRNKGNHEKAFDCYNKSLAIVGETPVGETSCILE